MLEHDPVVTEQERGCLDYGCVPGAGWIHSGHLVHLVNEWEQELLNSVLGE